MKLHLAFKYLYFRLLQVYGCACIESKKGFLRGDGCVCKHAKKAFLSSFAYAFIDSMLVFRNDEINLTL